MADEDGPAARAKREREARLAAALRRNLRLRKAQAREREGTAEPASPGTEDAGSGEGA